MNDTTDLNRGFFDSQCLFVCDQISLAILDVNEATVNYLGIPKTDLLSLTLHDLVKEVPSQIEVRLKITKALQPLIKYGI
jgi:light-regulated signal transduction histidine kinase (bacteriophytochrome)